MSVPPSTLFAEAVSIGTFSCMRGSMTGSLITCYSSLVGTPPYTILLDMAFLAAHPTDQCLLLVRWRLSLALVGTVLREGWGGGGCRCTGWWFITTSKAIGRIRDW